MLSGSTKSYRCTLVRVLPSEDREVAVVARRNFVYAGRRYRRGETAVVKAAALGHLLGCKKAIWTKDLNGTGVDGSIDGIVSQVSMVGAMPS